ncbi:MAG: tripartite tricarboxylate transporter substrate binding protein BugD [Alphaproteobacteria bacterium]|nr:MAG: tripartite tricarboxylate transporter substrate binding protein BugD [Alphaproteobacteria bacterium]
MPRMVLAAFAAMLALLGPAAAQDYPTRPITMVIPFAAGGPQDTIGRVFAQRMGEVLGQQVVVENVGGAGGMTGSKRVADALPDGYTMILASVGTHAQNQSLYKKPLYNAATDFTPVAFLAETPIALIVRKDLPVSNFKEFVAYAKANEAKMTYGSAGAGSATHLGCVILDSAIGVQIVHVPYRGTGPAMQDLQGGRIDYLCDIIATAKPQIDGGTVKGIAIMTKERSPVLPDLPTTGEQGLDVQAYTWSALFLPKGASDAVVRRLNAAAVEAIKTPALQERMKSLGATVARADQQGPGWLGAFVKSEIEKWAVPIKASGVSAD